MAWLRVTQHFKGHFPMDAGGVVFGGYGQKEVTPESFADACVKQNFPYVVHCSREGQYLDDVPAVTVVTTLVVPAVEAQVAPKSEAPAETGDVDTSSDALSSTIEVETETAAQRKARLKAEKASKE